MSELKQEFLQRSITAIFISAIVITLILYSSNLILKIFISILSLALFFEWMSVSKSSNGKRLIFLILFIILLSANHYFGGLFEPISLITMLGITVWIVVAFKFSLSKGVYHQILHLIIFGLVCY